MNTKIIIGSIVVIGLGLGAYFFFKKPKQTIASVKSDGGSGESAPESVGSQTSSSSPKLTGESSGSSSTTSPQNTTQTASTPQTKTSCSETKNLAGDKTWDYRKCDGVWFTRRKGTTGSWISLAGNKTATSKLDLAFPKL